MVGGWWLSYLQKQLRVASRDAVIVQQTTKAFETIYSSLLFFCQHFATAAAHNGIANFTQRKSNFFDIGIFFVRHQSCCKCLQIS